MTDKQWFLCGTGLYSEYGHDTCEPDSENNEFGARCDDCGGLLEAFANGLLYCPCCGWEEDL